MRISSTSFRMVVAIAACVAGAATGDAAEIRPDPSRDVGAVLEGKIEAGDFDKLRSFILDGDGAFKIYLASPGGDLAEAMKIGRFLRALKLPAVVPSELPSDLRARAAARHNLKEPKANFMCASACFFVFVAGISRSQDIGHAVILGIHRPYLSQKDLEALSGDQAIAAANRTRSTVESYLKEMGVPAKYTDQIFSVPKDEVRWISNDDFEADFEGFIPGLKDWVDARCDKRTDVEKTIWEALKNKTRAQQTTAERSMTEALMKKYEEQFKCEEEIRSDLALRAYQDALEIRSGRIPRGMLDRIPPAPPR